MAGPVSPWSPWSDFEKFYRASQLRGIIDEILSLLDKDIDRSKVEAAL